MGFVNVWSEAENDFLKENYGKMSNFDISVKIFELNKYLVSRSPVAIARQASVLGLKGRSDVKKIIGDNYKKMCAKWELRNNEKKKQLSTYSKEYFDYWNRTQKCR